MLTRGLSIGVAMTRPMKRSMSLRACILTLIEGLYDKGGRWWVSDIKMPYFGMGGEAVSSLGL